MSQFFASVLIVGLSDSSLLSSINIITIVDASGANPANLIQTAPSPAARVVIAKGV